MKQVTKMYKTNDERKALMKKLLQTPVKKIKFKGDTISLEFFGHRIKDKIIVKKEDHVAEWSRRHKQIFIDKELKKRELNKSFKALCVHEAIEKFLVEQYHLKLDEEAHIVARKKEKEYLKKLKGNWRSHQLIVYWNWHKHGEH